MIKFKIWALCTALGLAIFACGEGESRPDGSDEGGVDADASERRIEFFTVTERAGFIELLQKWEQMYKEEYPDAQLVQREVPRDNFTAYYDFTVESTNAGNPPDLVEATQDQVILMIPRTEGKFAKLDDLYDETGLRGAVVEGVTERMLVDYRGERSIYAVPHTLLRGTLLTYNITMLQAHDIEPPSTVEEFLAASEKLKQAGVTPLAISHERVALGALFIGLAQGVMGPEQFEEWRTGQLGADTSVLEETVDVFATVLENYTKNTGVTAYDLSAMPKLLLDEEVAMLFDGSWVVGFLQQQGWVYNVDFGAQAPPGASEIFQFFVSVYAMPSQAPHPEAARDYLRFLASPEAQIETDRILGGIPARTDVDQSRLSPFVQDSLRDLEEAEVVVMSIVRPEWEPAYVQFAQDLDKDKLLQAFADYPPIRQ